MTSWTNALANADSWSDFFQRLLSDLGDARYIKSFKNRIDTYAVPVSEKTTEIDRYAIDEDEINIIGTYAKRFDRLFYRERLAEPKGRLDFPDSLRNAIIEFFIETEPSFSIARTCSSAQA
jgi:hypothetical protein